MSKKTYLDEKLSMKKQWETNSGCCCIEKVYDIGTLESNSCPAIFRHWYCI